MSAAQVFFYLFSTVMIGSAFMVIAARNPVHSVLFLILAFVNAAGLFLILGAEFLAMLIVIVYVGAVAVLVGVDTSDRPVLPEDVRLTVTCRTALNLARLLRSGQTYALPPLRDLLAIYGCDWDNLKRLAISAIPE
jgi:hypothetical protein